MKTSDYIINVLTFPYPKEEKTFGFRTSRTNGEYPIHKSEFPNELLLNHQPELIALDYLYSDFTTTENCKYITPVDLTKSLFFSKHYYNYLIHQHFSKVADVVHPNFVRQNEVWFHSPKKSTTAFNFYYKFTIAVQVHIMSQLPELVIAYVGTSKVLKKSVLDLVRMDIDTKLLKTVIYNKKPYRFKDLPADVNNHLAQLFPVINLELGRALKMPFEPFKNKDKYKDYFNQIQHLLDKYLNDPEFKKIIPHSEKWLEVNNDSVLTTSQGSNLLRFGAGTHTDPYEGLKLLKPCSPAPLGHYRFFIIGHESDKASAELFLKYAKKELGFIDLSAFLSIPLTVDHDKSIYYKDKNNPLPEIEHALEWTSFDPNTNYLAVYITPYNKLEANPARRNLYFTIKQILLEYKINSQFIHTDNILNENFKFSMTNIAIAVLAKLGGIPWRLDRKLNDELIIGIGAFKSKKYNVPFLANTICFSNDGTFKEFNTLPADNNFLLAGLIKDAVAQYHSQNRKASRIIIHFYKIMSNKELTPIIKTLNSLRYDIPVIIVTVNKTTSNNFIMFDQDYEHLMPYSGSYISVGYNNYILFNNTRYRPEGNEVNGYSNGKVKSFPLPIKLHFRSTDPSILADKEQLRQLMDQLYQFSRMYWKSVTQQNLPVTVNYPAMIAEMYPHFQGSKIPEFGKTNLWFL
jgi:hypothetical protein